MRKLNPYSIGETPTFDPCEKCLVKSCCSEICDDRLRYTMKLIKNRPRPLKITLRGKKII